MATRITDRAVIISKGTIAANGCEYTVYHDGQVGQRVKMDQGSRWWLILKPKDSKKIIQSTTVQKVYAEWMDLIAQNGTDAY